MRVCREASSSHCPQGAGSPLEAQLVASETRMRLQEPFLTRKICMLEPQCTSWGWVTPSKLSSSLIWEAYRPLTTARPLSSQSISVPQISALKDPQICSTREGKKAERSLQGKLPSRAVNSHFQQRLWLCWLRALCWLPLSARLAAGGARNSSAIPGAKGQSSA